MTRPCSSSPAKPSRLWVALLGLVVGTPALPLVAQTADQAPTPNQGLAQQGPQLQSGNDFALIRADHQSYDRQLGLAVASGNVEVTLRGWRLWADRLEYAEASRSLRASGQVRLQKGDQYLQASSLRYSDWEGSGELLDVYGVIDRDTLPAALENAPDTAPADSAPSGAAPSFACPPLAADAADQRLLQLLPPSRQPLPTIAAPPGCPGADATAPQASLAERLNAIALGSGPPDGPIRPMPSEPTGSQEVRDVRFQQSFSTAIKLDLAAVIDTADSGDPSGLLSRPDNRTNGTVSRLRFQSSRIRMQGDRWNADAVAFTNDPFTPANSWTIARNVQAVLDRSRGTTAITARSSRIVLDQRVSVPAITNATIGQEEARWVIDVDREDRDGVYLGYNLPSIRIGQRGSLELQPQFMIQRAFEGRTNSYIAPGASLGSPTIDQTNKAGDLFGLDALMSVPLGPLQFDANASLSTLNPDNIASGTRGISTLSLPLGLNWAPNSSFSLFGGYRERVYNGSLGEQNLIYSYGARLSGGTAFHFNASAQPGAPVRTPYFTPLSVGWRAQTGNYQANLFESNELATLWRTNLNLSASTSLRLWEGRAAYRVEGLTGLRYSPTPIVPGLGIDLGLNGTINEYGDGSNQQTLTLWGGPSITLGRLERRWLDYTKLAVSLGGTFYSGLSPFGFDRAVDLRTLSFKAAQQLYGPLVVEGGLQFNIDPNSEFYGDTAYGYVEVKLQRRSYEIGIYYSPYDGIGGIRLKLNDFNFTGTGTPFVPRPTGAREAGPLSQR
jgi:lipopolysaccharide export system protein LptA